MGKPFTICMYSQVMQATIVSTVEASSPAAAVERCLQAQPGWMAVRFVSAYAAPLPTPLVKLEDVDLTAQALHRNEISPMRAQRSARPEFWTVAAYWNATGEALAHEEGGAYVRATTGVIAMATVLTGIAPASELTVVAAIPGIQPPLLTAALGTAPMTLGPFVEPTLPVDLVQRIKK